MFESPMMKSVDHQLECFLQGMVIILENNFSREWNSQLHNSEYKLRSRNTFAKFLHHPNHFLKTTSSSSELKEPFKYNKLPSLKPSSLRSQPYVQRSIPAFHSTTEINSPQ